MKTNINIGLDDQIVSELQAKEGKNELPGSRRKTIFHLVWNLIKDPTVFILIGCGVIYLLLGDPMEAYMLLTFLIIIIFITLIQENKAEKALDALKSLSSPRVLVLRSGQKRRIPGSEVVRGDVIFMAEGDKVPADSRIHQSSYLATDESLLTGESIPVSKENNSIIFAGSTVVSGQGIALVEAIGSQTQLGKIGLSLNYQGNQFSSLEKQTHSLIRKLTWLAIGICVFVIIFYALKKHDWLSASLIGMTLAMAILPNELPAVVSIFFALGAKRMAEKKVLTRKLSAIENLGSVTVLAVDKTGTLTMNQMQLQRIMTLKDSIELDHSLQDLPEEFHEVLEYGILASRKDPFDPMELAFIEAGSRYLKDTEHLHHEWELSKEYPLTRELLSISHAWKSSSSESYTVGAKGAPEAIIDLCHLDQTTQNQIQQKAQVMASLGLRVIGVAKATNAVEPLPGHQHDFNFTFLGLIGIADPIRSEIPQAVSSCEKAGVRLIMITGDHPVTARSIAKKIGMKNDHLVLTGNELSNLTPVEFELKIKDINIFCRVSPLQKLQIVEAFKKMGHVVAMTGDGVNDAPALKNADIGIGMGARGTDVARESSSIVLMNDDFNSIIEAIKMGRRVFNNLTRAIKYLCAVHIPIAGISVLPIIFDLPIILLPAHVALLHLLIEPASTIAFEVIEAPADIMDRPPRAPNSSMFTNQFWKDVLIQGMGAFIVLTVILLVSFQIGFTTQQVRALVFTSLMFSNLALLNEGKRLFKSKISSIIGLIPLIILLMALYLRPIQELFKFEQLKFGNIFVVSVLGYFSVMIKDLWRILPIAQKKT